MGKYCEQDLPHPVHEEVRKIVKDKDKDKDLSHPVHEEVWKIVKAFGR